MTFVIEKGIQIPPIPEYRARAGRPALRNWSSLEIGDSVLVPTRSAAHTAYDYGNRHGRAFTVAKRAEEDGRRGWRVWRTA